MVETSIGISATPLIVEESIFDPVLGIITGTVYGGVKIFDKIRHRNKEDYTIDALTDDKEEEK